MIKGIFSADILLRCTRIFGIVLGLLLLTLVIGCRSGDPSVSKVDADWLRSWRATNSAWRGVHLGVHNDADLDALTQELPQFANLGVNALVLEVDYHFEFQSHPELRADRFVTKARASEFARAARAQGIRLIPQLNCLGHQS